MTDLALLLVFGAYALAALIFIVVTLAQALKPGGELDERAARADRERAAG